MLDDEYPDLTVSFLQVLAILSFEKENHERLKSPGFLIQLTGTEKEDKKSKDGKGGIFGKILQDFDQLMESKHKQKKQDDD